ncbi:hypothetical protein D9V30_00195 [Mycetocola reblochoni]|uniref:Uncharacterized protein n=2 Tax=Mycetocola reblochoni TaxID=331618 RepID=A0A1R4IXR4_9MICO|nr:hypothetical protein [Mycetocola reblochoni]RLP70892.1 hypothetical protein D9V30_00195 [Mycetocola reblochoni]SJN24676.1 hypothetical protein FM119_04410 [Mycetocola reblochoni REB411]
MTTTNETRIEVEQTADAREAAIRDLTEHDRIVYRHCDAPAGKSVESGLFANKYGDLATVSGQRLSINGIWIGSRPHLTLLAVIKREPPFDPKPGEVWGSKTAFTDRAVFLSGGTGEAFPWLAHRPGSNTSWHTTKEIQNAIREHGWVKLYEGGQEVAR